ncbi:hypothetical protein AB0H76_28900 [Nocardia sp. NPDC050712]|uniref:hypothetical protein n=1 Tax=Nocardia sp. NPDC050712 TaxID=3155518 RepID=UPI0033D5E34C
MNLLHRLPEIAVLRDRCRAVAALDAVLAPDWADRCFSFDSAWDDGQELASIRDGSGNDWFIVFTEAGCYGRGFDHEAPATAHLFDAVPAAFRPFVDEPAFADFDGSPRATVCFWREPGDDAWGISGTDSGADELLEVLVDGTPEAYRRWAADYYEAELDPTAVRHVFELRPLTAVVLSGLNPDPDLNALGPDLVGIGYPR